MDVLDTGVEAASAAVQCASAKFVPVNPADWVMSYIPTVPLAIALIVVTIMMFVVLGHLLNGEGTAAFWLFLSAAGVALAGYAIHMGLAMLPVIGDKYECRKASGSTMMNTINRGHKFAERMKNWPVV